MRRREELFLLLVPPWLLLLLLPRSGAGILGDLEGSHAQCVALDACLNPSKLACLVVLYFRLQPVSFSRFRTSVFVLVILVLVFLIYNRLIRFQSLTLTQIISQSPARLEVGFGAIVVVVVPVMVVTNSFDPFHPARAVAVRVTLWAQIGCLLPSS